jgi:hypothetical protein
MTNEAVFKFDTTHFMKSVQQMENRLGQMSRNMQNIGRTITSAVRTGATHAAMAIGGMMLAFKGVQNAFNKGLPEIGQAFNIASDIISKNFFWPLRQQLMPVLNDILSWVTENRTLFVRWGAAIGNVFKSVVLTATELYKVVKTLVDAVGNSFQKAWGTSFQNFQEFLDVLSFKIAVVVIWFGLIAEQAMTKIQPLFNTITKLTTEALGKIAPEVIDLAKRAGELAMGMIDDAVDSGALQAALEVITSCVISLKENVVTVANGLASIWHEINQPDPSGNNLTTILESLKETVGGLKDFFNSAFKGLFEGFKNSISESGVMKHINDIINLLNDVISKINGTGGVESAFKNLGNVIGNTLGAAIGGIKITIDFIITGIRSLFVIFSDAENKAAQLKDLWSGFGERTGDTIAASAYLTAFEGLIRNLGDTIREKHTGEAAYTGSAEAAASTGRRAPSESIKLPYMEGVNDVVITKRGDIIKTHPDDTIFAAKKDILGGNSGGRGGPVTVTFGNIYITVTEGDARAAGRNFSEGVAETLANALNRQMELEGY